MRRKDGIKGCHPRVRSSCLRFWPMDDLDPTEGQNINLGPFPAALSWGLTENPAWTNVPAVADPFIIPSPIGGLGRRFYEAGGVNSAFWSAGDTDAQAAHEGDITLGVWLRIDDLPAGTQYVYAYAGTIGDTTGVKNYMLTLRVTAAGQFETFWEWGTGATQNTVIWDEFTMPLREWVYVVLRKSSTTGPGPAGTMDLDLYVNGAHVQQFVGETNTSGGADADFRIGHEESAANVAQGFLTGDLAGVYLWSAALTPEEIAEDYRRSLLFPFFTRVDLRVLVDNSAGVEEDLTDLDGLDWVDSVELSDAADNATITATVNMLREQKNLSLSYLKTDSKPNLSDITDLNSWSPILDHGRGIKILAARVPLGTCGRDLDFHSVFQGRIDEISWGGDGAQVTCRDLGGVLIDTYMEEEFDYSDDPPPSGSGPFAVEGEMQQILFDNDDATNGIRLVAGRAGSFDPITLYVHAAGGQIVPAGTLPSPVNWEVLKWRQTRAPVLSALRSLAGQIGWECRYRFDQTTDEWRLIFYEPYRQQVATDSILAPQDILTISDLNIKANAVRNVVRVGYPSSETGSLPSPAPLTDFGINPVTAIESQGWSDIDGKDQRMMAFYQLELSDSVTKYGRRFMEVGESPSSQIDTVIEAQRMAVGMALDLQEPDETQAITIPAFPEVELQDYCRFLANDHLYTEAQDLAVQTYSHSFGDTAETTITARGKPAVGFKRWLSLETRPGVAEPGVINPLDALSETQRGGILATLRSFIDDSDYFTFGKFLALKNGSFQFFSAGMGNFPDSWFPDPATSPTWGAAGDFFHSATAISGGRSLKLNSSGNFFNLFSDLIPIQGDPNTPFSFDVVWQRVTAGSDYGVTLYVEWLEADRFTTITVDLVDDFQGELGTAGEWFSERKEGVLPPVAGTARFARLYIAQLSAAGTVSDILVDQVATYYTGRGFRLYKQISATPQIPLAGTPWENLTWSSPPALNSYDFGNNRITPQVFPGSGDGFLAREAGVYRYTLQVAMGTQAGAGTYGNIRITRNATYDTRRKTNSPDVIAQGSQTELVPRADVDLATLQVGGSPVPHAGICSMSGAISLDAGDTLHAEWWSDGDTAIALGTADTTDLMTFFDVKIQLND